MKKLLILALIPFLIECNSKPKKMEDKNTWDSYMAMYEKGPGSMVYNTSLIKTAPNKDMQFIVITGVTFKNCTKDGLPEKDEFENLYKISDDVQKIIEELTQIAYAGSFTYQCQRLDYIYVKDTTDIKNKLSELYKSKYNNYTPYINIKQDINWEAYLQFLYPNEETQEFTKNQKILSQLQANGDDLTKPRHVDYWIYFNNETDRDAFKKIIINEGFKVENEDKLNDNSAKPFKLHISRIDSVNINYITKVTLGLRDAAKQTNGDYDGWETVIIK
ncbi:MAG TPA: DUF695 domain-containing protein [Bacteroidia bacterium]|jgi:uncharacterized protein (TIGR01619 family)|nr:DUF695 domain-containing protein [Bacteroidia bacterium]